MAVEIMRMQKGGRMDHHEEILGTGKVTKYLKYHGMDAAQLTLARAVSKLERVAKEAKKKAKYYRKGVLRDEP